MSQANACEAALERSPLFAGVAPEALHALLAAATLREIDEGERLLAPGMENDCVYLVAAGALGVFADERARLPLATIRAGGCAGEQSVLDREAPPALVVAIERTRLVAVPAAALWRAMEGAPRIAFNLLQLLSRGVRLDHERHAAFEATTSVDLLTGVHNRRWMQEMFERELTRCERAREAASLLLIDVDHLGHVNGSLGQPSGDRLLARLGELLRRALRPHDLCARYGGEEFCVLLPGAGGARALRAAERIRARVERSPASVSRDVRIGYTVSIGVVEWRAGQTLAELLRAAEAALGAAKEGGRNRVHAAIPEATPA